jgi:nucleotide-binding universal stress UspA family protein
VTILHPTDFSECAEQARAQAIRLARALGAEVVLLHVSVEAPLYGEGFLPLSEVRKVFDAQREWATQALEERAAESRGAGIPTLARVLGGTPHEAIVATAKQLGADLIVMGTHGRGALERFFLGSVADRVIRSAPCPVLTVRETTGKGD